MAPGLKLQTCISLDNRRGSMYMNKSHQSVDVYTIGLSLCGNTTSIKKKKNTIHGCPVCTRSAHSYVHGLSFINEGELHADIISRGPGLILVGEQWRCCHPLHYG